MMIVQNILIQRIQSVAFISILRAELKSAGDYDFQPLFRLETYNSNQYEKL